MQIKSSSRTFPFGAFLAKGEYGILNMGKIKNWKHLITKFYILQGTASKWISFNRARRSIHERNIEIRKLFSFILIFLNYA